MAARGGFEDEPFPWGEAEHDLHTRLNAWEGEFPDQNHERDGPPHNFTRVPRFKTRKDAQDETGQDRTLIWER